MIQHWQRLYARLALAATGILILLLLTGCEAPYGSLYGEKWAIPGTTFGVDPLLLIVGIIVFGLLGPLVTLVILAVLLPFLFPPAYRVRVRGVTNLRVVDASVLPTMVSGNLNGPVSALAWRAADLIVEDARPSQVYP